jgi:hypothetical protein
MGSKARAAARERIAAQRAAQARRDRLRRMLMFVLAGAGVLILGVVGIWVGATRHSTSSAAVLPRPVAASGTGTPPWPVPADSVARAKAAGLAIGSMEGTAKHFHIHLDLIVDGHPVTVPAQLGIDDSGYSELHTHDTTGVVHIEAPTLNKRYILGEVFQEWNVRLDSGDLGGLRADATHPLTAYVDGKKWTGDPAAIELVPHREIALVYNSPGAQVPHNYAFAPGL